MPIQLDDIASITQAKGKATTPKYFSQSLTGAGKAVGVINSSIKPGRYSLGSTKATMPTNTLHAKTKSSGSSVTTRTIPFAPLTQYSLEQSVDRGLTVPVASAADRFHVTASATKLDFDVFLDLTPQGAMLYEDGSGDKISRELNILYRMEVYVLAKDGAPDSERVPYTGVGASLYGRAFDRKDERVLLNWSYAPLDDAEELIRQATMSLMGNSRGVFVDQTDLAEWMAEYDVHERICRLADAWASDDMADIIVDHITEMFAHGRPSDSRLQHLALQLRYLETYNVSLRAYRRIHAAIDGTCPSDVASELSKQNLNLLMSHTLENLNSLKPQLSSPPSAALKSYALPPHYSAQQRAAITTDEPLVLVIAGAGTGKTTAIGGRIDYLTACGVDPKDVTVLSFTNAAADNVKERFPQVGSMTIARMIHDIYVLNHPTHELSTIDTILNSLDIFFPQSDFARQFRRLLMNVDKNETGSTTQMNAFIERFYDETIMTLDKIRQTCLELEIIIAYQRIDTMIEPANVQSRYLIIDEVQDNSIFEFIYMLKYVAKHKENMFIVGDAAQTLFEFRASNPKALNALEESGVFATYQLTTNYRSNQEVLDFANVHLADIEANRTSGLRLQANSLQMPTADSFQEKVTLHYEHYTHITKIKDDLADLVGTVVRGYIDGCLARGEQVAFLAYSRAQVKQMELKLQEMYPNQHVASLVSDKTFSTTVFSEYVKQFWSEVVQVDPADAPFVVTKGVNDNVDSLIRKSRSGSNDKAKLAIGRMVSEWWIASGNDVNGWVALYQQGALTRDRFFEQLQENILDYEIKHNSIKQSLMNQKNRERKEKNVQAKSPLVVSTIHGAKGLEFDNVVVVHKYDSQMAEDAKRLYYVAFTRAMNTEFVLSYGTSKNARIESDHKMIVEALEKRDKVEALRVVLAQQGQSMDALSEDEVEQALAAFESASALSGDGQSDEQSDAVDAVNDLLAGASARQDGGTGAAPVEITSLEPALVGAGTPVPSSTGAGTASGSDDSPFGDIEA